MAWQYDPHKTFWENLFAGGGGAPGGGAPGGGAPGGGSTPMTYTPSPYGQPNYQPKVEDYYSALFGDYARAQGLQQQDFQRKAGSLEEYKKALSGIQTFGLQAPELAYQEGVQRWDTAVGKVREETGRAYTSGVAGIDQALTNIRTQIGQFSSGALDFAGDVWGKGKAALGEFRNEVGNMMTSWVTGHQETTAQEKKETAARLAAEGYRPDEIEAEMRKIDMRSTQEQAGKSAEFSQFEEQQYRTLQAAYTGIGAQTETAMRTVIGQLTQAGAAAEMGGAELKSALGQWAAGVNSSAVLGAEEAATNLLLNKTQFQLATNMLTANGMGQWANMMQGLDSSFVPFSDMIATILATEIGLENRNYGWLSAGLSAENAAIALTAGATGQAQSGLMNWGT